MKQLLATILIIVLVFSAAGCGKSDSQTPGDDANTTAVEIDSEENGGSVATTSATATTTSATTATTTPSEATTTTTTTAPTATATTTTTATTTAAAPEAEIINIGDTIVTSQSEIKIDKIEFSQDVLPDDTSGFYTHYEAEPGKTIVHIETDVKNIQKDQLECDEIMNVSVDYNNGFVYYGGAVPEGDSGFTYANITAIDPLETKGVRFLIDCPIEVAESGNSVVISFETVDGVFYEYTMVVGNGDPASESTATPVEAILSEGGAFSIGDTITTSQSEVTINNIEFSYDVLPDDTTSKYYNHHEAESGHVYVHIDADVMNTGKEPLMCNELLTVEVDYNDGYKYTGEAVPENSTSGFGYANITAIDPLEIMGVRFLVDCPQEVAESENPVIVKLVTVDGLEFEYKVK